MSVMRHHRRVRRLLCITSLLSAFTLACSGASDDPVVADPGTDTGVVRGDDGTDTNIDTAVDDTSGSGGDSTPGGDAADVTPVGDAPADTATGEAAADGGPSIDALCAGVAAASFEPPSVCDGPSGYTTTVIPKNRMYSTSWFGCYKKPDGTIYKDPTDNCLFACGSKGLCASGLSGPECEATLQWFAADADRYSCGGRVRVTNCVNKRQVVLVTLDRGPNCKTVEKVYGVPSFDMSYPAMTYLFEGKTYGVSDKKRVIVESVGGTTALGPVK